MKGDSSQKKLYSLRKRIFFAFFFSYLMLFIFIVITSVFYYRIELRHSEETYSVLTENTAKQIDSDLANIQNFVLTTMINHSDLTLLESAADQASFPQIQARFVNYMRDYTASLSSASGVFFYLPRIDRFMFAVNKESSFPYAVQTTLHNYEGSALIRALRSGYRRWRFTEHDNALYLEKYLTYGSRVGGAWISYSKLESQYGLSGAYRGSLMLFASQTDGSYYTEDASLTAYTFTPGRRRCYAEYNGKKTDYLQVSAPLAHCDEQLVLLIPLSNIRKELKEYTRVGYIIFGTMLGAFIFFYLTVRKNLAVPINNLRRVSAAFREGETDTEAFERLQQDIHSIEVQEITRGIGDLVDQLSAVKNRVLMEEYAKNSFELQSLKNQVSPHFLINSLSSISSLSSVSTDPALVRTLISLLASHLRYTMSQKTSVSISEEVQHLTEYYKMMQIRYPNSLEYEIDIEGLCEDAAIFPSLILMLSENSVKHNLAVGELLTIRVTAVEQDLNGQQVVRITHRDSGRGFDEAVLEQLNRLSDTPPEAVREGQNIGLYNIVRRLSLAYPDKESAITFSNDENGGAVISLVIPYIPYTES
ncbi:MAG: histidine kinase [Lachnospiraceae bacterium]|nr:histidine kinase [Lachnospiraceae bacterium]